jgi:hypothetical protein
MRQAPMSNQNSMVLTAGGRSNCMRRRTNCDSQPKPVELHGANRPAGGKRVLQATGIYRLA